MKHILNLFRKPNAQKLAEIELQDAERQLLASQATAEYATSMANYNQNRIRRLRKYLQDGQAA